MDLSNKAIHDVIHPTAIYLTPPDAKIYTDHDGQLETLFPTEPVTPSWDDSQLNPKNRIDSLAPLRSPLWAIDGCAGLGTQFYAVPLFLEDAPPMRWDVFICEEGTKSPLLRKLLDLDNVFHARDHARVQRQGVCHYILRALQGWTARYGLDRFREAYYYQPFGTRIVFNNLPLNVRDVDVRIVLAHDVEAHHCSIKELASLWHLDVEKQMPPAVDIYDLAYIQQLHDSVCTVRYRDSQESIGRKGGTRQDLWVLKALTSSVKYMYHELRVLLDMPPHQNIIARPMRLVTKKGRMNNKRELVVGFLVPFYSGGGLRDKLPLLRLNGLLQFEDQMHWVWGICQGMLHIRNEGHTYYPDLRLDQIVFPHDDQRRPIILDFEQRGVWCEFGPPEINAFEYLRILALDEDEHYEPEIADFGSKDSWPSCQRFSDILDRLRPDWRDLASNNAQYKNAPNGFNIAWMCLTPREQEHAEVYMLGRLMWCIFEGMSAPQRGAVWQSYHNEPEFDFPEFRRTPEALRVLISRCTRGHRDQLSNYVVRKGSKIVLRDHPNESNGDPARIRSVAKDFWMREIMWAEEFVLNREKIIKEGYWDENIFKRPTLKEIIDYLTEFQTLVAFEEATD